MAQVKITGIKKLKFELRTRVKKALRDKGLRNAIGEQAAKLIKKKTLGTPAKRTLEWRRRYDPINPTDRAYNRDKINVTFTGELLADLASNVKANTTRFRLIIKNSNKKHKKYNGLKKKIGSRAKYSDISKGLIDKGYDYLDFSQGDLKKLTKILQVRVVEFITKG